MKRGDGPTVGQEGTACLRCIEEAQVWIDRPATVKWLLEKSTQIHAHLDLPVLAEQTEAERKIERYRVAMKKLRTPDEMRRFIEDPASDPELARELADAARLLQRLIDPELIDGSEGG